MPSQGIEATYRNDMVEVQQFFEERHAGKFKVYNLCSERDYDPFKFGGNVSRFPFDDHNPCPFSQVDPFCISVGRWLGSGKNHVAAIHCKAGKGRTGFLISCFLLHSQRAPNAAEALRIFAVKRTYDGKGVTIPSQIRYVNYYDRFLRNDPVVPQSQPLYITSATIQTIPTAVRSASVDVWFTIKLPEKGGSLVYSSKGKIPARRVEADADNPTPMVLFKPSQPKSLPVLDQDVKIEFFHSTTFGKEKMFQFWYVLSGWWWVVVVVVVVGGGRRRNGGGW